MPPRPAGGRGVPARGGPRGAAVRGGPAIRGARGAAPTRGGLGGGRPGTVLPAAHVKTIGVKRDGQVGYGRSGRVVQVQVNAFNATIPNSTIHHYNGESILILSVLTPDNLPARVNHQIIRALQFEVAPEIFTPHAVYDGRKNVFCAARLPFAEGDSQDFDIPLASGNAGASNRQPKVYKVRLELVATINPEVLARFVKGEQSHEEEATTAITACNVAIRMSPSLNLTFNSRSFFTPLLGERDLKCGIELWMGLFQSYRPGPERALVNVDIATGMMYKSGPLIEVCLDALGVPREPKYRSAKLLSYAHGLTDERRIPLARFVKGIQVVVDGGPKRVIRGLTNRGANQIKFDNNGKQMTIAEYFHQKRGKPLMHEEVICAEVGRNVLVPLEVCMVPPGQIARKQPPPAMMKDVIDFAKKRPDERFQVIRQGVQHLEYGQSEYIRSFGIEVDTSSGPLRVEGRLLEPPKLTYAQGASVTVDQKKGAWNMAQKKVYSPCRTIKHWVIVSYESQRFFNESTSQRMVRDLISEAHNMGITFEDKRPFVRYLNGSAKKVGERLVGVMRDLQASKGIPRPDLCIVILPDGGDEIYTAVKHFGDITGGVTTQCLKSRNCAKTNPQFWANVLLKINVKLGGINWIPTGGPSASLDDPTNPTIIMGADAIHPAPGADGRPSFTALVSSVDKHCVRYIATSRVQEGRLEIIEDLKGMVMHCLRKYVDYRRVKEQQRLLKPRRLIFFRDGVSEGQFEQVLEKELRFIKEALIECGMQDCKVTFVVVGKRHHIRFNPVNDGDKDFKSGNAFAGLVVDKGIGHPVEFDFYLQSHGGLLGTSRSSHYNVLYDDNKFNADALQNLAFSLCHIYARATRSVSIPAPVYYADIVCSRAKTHYDPAGGAFFSDTGTVSSQGAAAQLVVFKEKFKPLSQYAENRMYFS